MSAPLFLERRRYRRRRLTDAARLLPILGALLFALPLLWPTPEQASAGAGEAGGAAGVAMAQSMIYIFAVWAGLILSALLISWRLSRAPEAETETGARGAAPGEPG